MLKIIRKISRFLLVFYPMLVAAQVQPLNFSDSLNALAGALYTDKSDSIKLLANRDIERLISEHLLDMTADEWHPDSLKFLKTVSPENHSFRLVTWSYPLEANRQHYSGLLVVYRKSPSVQVFTLNYQPVDLDVSGTYSCCNWPGAVYYKLIEKKGVKGRFYTMFGWRAGEPGKAQRVIETMSFDDSGAPVFGLPVLSVEPPKIQNRVFFEFTDEVPFHLAYERHKVPGKKRKTDEMIIFNRMTGNDPKMGRLFRANVPDWGTFDGFVFKDRQWQLVRDIDARIREK